MSIHSEAELTGVGGLRIYWQAWTPEDRPRAVVVVSHGAGEHSGRYRHVALRLLSQQYAVYAIEHRGHGHSAGPRALIDRMDNAVADLDSLITLAAGRHSATPVFLLGHSMGATISLCYAIRQRALAGTRRRLAGLILSGPLAALPATPAPVRIAARVLSALAPRAPLIAVDPTFVSRDPMVVRAYVADPLVHHGKLPARTVAELAAAVESFPNAVGALTLPTLILYGTADRVCPTTGSLMLGERIGASDNTLKAYDGLYHEILNEPEQDLVLTDICSWLSARIATR
ncbi:MAG: lysophospholipase [Solirubrobacteraceae bacterium]